MRLNVSAEHTRTEHARHSDLAILVPTPVVTLIQGMDSDAARTETESLVKDYIYSFCPYPHGTNAAVEVCLPHCQYAITRVGKTVDGAREGFSQDKREKMCTREVMMNLWVPGPEPHPISQATLPSEPFSLVADSER